MTIEFGRGEKVSFRAGNAVFEYFGPVVLGVVLPPCQVRAPPCAPFVLPPVLGEVGGRGENHEDAMTRRQTRRKRGKMFPTGEAGGSADASAVGEMVWAKTGRTNRGRETDTFRHFPTENDRKVTPNDRK